MSSASPTQAEWVVVNEKIRQAVSKEMNRMMRRDAERVFAELVEREMELLFADVFLQGVSS